MNSPTVDINRLVFARAKRENSGAMLDIIRTCVSEVNAADYTQAQVRELLDGFTADWLENIISTRHYYEVWYDGSSLRAAVSAGIIVRKNKATSLRFLYDPISVKMA